MKNCLLFVFVTFFLFSCASTNDGKISYKEMINSNARNVSLLKAGMSMEEVISVMGVFQSEVRSGVLNNPWRIEASGDVEIYHYLTRGHPPFTPILSNQATPVVFKNGEVVAIGREFLKEAKANSLKNSKEVEFRNKLEQLKRLYEQELITKEEYESKKSSILDDM